MPTLIQSGYAEEEEGGGTVGAVRALHTHHDNTSRLLNCAHAHDGRHANGGALEVNPTDVGWRRYEREKYCNLHDHTAL